MDTLTDTLEELDFTVTIPCEHPNHGSNNSYWHAGDAWAVVDYHCQECPHAVRQAICRGLWDAAMDGLLIQCRDCGHTSPGSEVYTFVTLV